MDYIHIIHGIILYFLSVHKKVGTACNCFPLLSNIDRTEIPNTYWTDFENILIHSKSSLEYSEKHYNIIY